MSASNDPDHFFQTSQSLAESKRKARKSKNAEGSPIRLQSKILAAVADPSSQGEAVLIAESAGSVRRVVVDTGEKDTVYTGPRAPVTSIAISPDGQRILAGSWDKSIWSWSSYTRHPLIRYRGHTDFVKCVVTLRIEQKDILVSGAADASIIVWDILSGGRIHTLKGHTRGVLDLAVDPIIHTLDEDAIPGMKEALIFSAGSEREIRRWRISLDAAEEVNPSQPILAHETSVYALCFDADDDLWTASADGTAKCLSRSRQFEADTTIPHEGHVRAIAIDEVGGYVVTAGRDEDVKVWDRSTGHLIHAFVGHYEEVTGLLVLDQRCVSVGIDGTVRVWSLKPGDLQTAKSKPDKEPKSFKEDNATAQEERVLASGLTEEEERELAELMQDSE